MSEMSKFEMKLQEITDKVEKKATNVEGKMEKVMDGLDKLNANLDEKRQVDVGSKRRSVQFFLRIVILICGMAFFNHIVEADAGKMFWLSYIVAVVLTQIGWLVKRGHKAVEKYKAIHTTGYKGWAYKHMNSLATGMGILYGLVSLWCWIRGL